MAETVELVFKRDKRKETIRALIQRHARESIAGGSTDWEIFEGKEVSRERYGVDDVVHAAFRKTFFLTTKHFVTATPRGGVHIIEYRQVDPGFFALFKYPDPGPLWPLIEILRRRTETDRTFSGPPALRKFVRYPTEAERREFKLRGGANEWNALAVCQCGNESFRLRYLGGLQDGMVCDLDAVYQRTELDCASCGKQLLLFDAALNGYNPTIADWPPKPTTARAAELVYSCECGADQGRFAVSVIYDCDPETLRGLNAAKRNESYGWIAVTRRCTRCEQITEVVNYECA